ncbi:hypothetical protein ACJRO7_000938 [Eucalyptus globulus]|uniref:CASP-like protein n=1 Tax=Eucalyptus globulus TaxID=34317 RepID=A0ABD3LSI8_EUCGL
MVEKTLEQNQPIPMSRNHFLLGTTTQICLRVLPIAATLAAALVMMTSKQFTRVFGIPVYARYTYSPAFNFFAYANLVSCALCLLYSLFLLIIVVMTLMMTGCAATMAIGYVGKHIDAHIGWMPICDHLGKFCDKVAVSIAISFASFLLLMILTVISARNYGIVFRSASSKFPVGDYAEDRSR